MGYNPESDNSEKPKCVKATILHTWISVNGSHFTSEVISDLCKQLTSVQSFTVAYSPWINGSVERLNRDVLNVLHVLILEYNLHSRDWPALIPLVQASLNHTALPSLGNHAPIELFTGLLRPSPLSAVLDPSRKSERLVSADPAKVATYIATLRTSIEEMHRDVVPAREKQTLHYKKKARGESVVNFSVGDFVLRSRVDEKHKDKLLVTWVGPYMVVRANKHSVDVRDLVTNKELTVHGSRLKFYAENDLQVTDELLQHASSLGTILEVKELQQHRWNERIKDFQFLVTWIGLEEIEESCETMTTLTKDITAIVNKYVEAANDSKLLAHWERIKPNKDR